MFKTMLALIPGVLLAGSALASPFQITNATSLGRCSADLRIEPTDDGAYLLVADFNDVYAAAENPSSRDFQYCTLKYDINLAPNYVIRRIDTTVEGYYSVSPGSKVVVGVENRAVGSSRSVNQRYVFNQPTDNGNLEYVVGSINRSDLPGSAQVPGGTVQLNTKYTVEAVQGNAPGGTDVRLTTATAGGSSYPICKIYVQQQ